VTSATAKDPSAFQRADDKDVGKVKKEFRETEAESNRKSISEQLFGVMAPLLAQSPSALACEQTLLEENELLRRTGLLNVLENEESYTTLEKSVSMQRAPRCLTSRCFVRQTLEKILAGPRAKD